MQKQIFRIWPDTGDECRLKLKIARRVIIFTKNLAILTNMSDSSREISQAEENFSDSKSNESQDEIMFEELEGTTGAQQ